MSQRAEGLFTVVSFVPAEVKPAVEIVTAMDTGVAMLEKQFTGDVEGHSVTWFSGARNAESGAGSYVAVEAFAGSLNGVEGTFNFVHAASTHGEDAYGGFFAIVDASGTAGLAGITGTGGLVVDPDGTHRIFFTYDLDQ